MARLGEAHKNKPLSYEPGGPLKVQGLLEPDEARRFNDWYQQVGGSQSMLIGLLVRHMPCDDDGVPLFISAYFDDLAQQPLPSNADAA